MVNTAGLLGHNYLGPGNPFPNGDPVCEADRIAQQHDWAYSQTSSNHFQHIQEADQQAIIGFNGVKESNPLHYFCGKLGLAGIQSKYTVENALGQIIYPPNLPGNGESS